DMQHDYYRPNVTSHFRGGLDAHGNTTAWINDYTTDDGANSEAHIKYGIGDQAIRTAKVATHVPVGPWRSVEASWHGFFIESFADELAHAAGKDPLEFRRAMLANAPRHLNVLNVAAEKAGWGTPMPAGRARALPSSRASRPSSPMSPKSRSHLAARSRSTGSYPRSMLAARSIPMG